MDYVTTQGNLTYEQMSQDKAHVIAYDVAFAKQLKKRKERKDAKF